MQRFDSGVTFDGRLYEFAELTSSDPRRGFKITGDVAGSGKSEFDLPLNDQNPIPRRRVEVGRHLLPLPIGYLTEEVEGIGKPQQRYQKYRKVSPPYRSHPEGGEGLFARTFHQLHEGDDEPSHRQ